MGPRVYSRDGASSRAGLRRDRATASIKHCVGDRNAIPRHAGSTTGFTSAPPYSLDAWRQLRTQRQLTRPEQSSPRLSDEPTIPWQQWFLTVAVKIDEAVKGVEEPCVDVYTANCSGTPVWLVRQGPRWLMFAGSRQPESRRRDFASPSLDHAKRTAEAWYGLPKDGWRAEGAHQKTRQNTAVVEVDDEI